MRRKVLGKRKPRPVWHVPSLNLHLITRQGYRANKDCAFLEMVDSLLLKFDQARRTNLPPEKKGSPFLEPYFDQKRSECLYYNSTA